MEYARYPDEELVRRFQDGDVLAFEALFDRYGETIYNFALRFLGDSADAEDVAQHTFVQAFEALGRLDAAGSVRPWLFQVARNRCNDFTRRRRTAALRATEDGGEHEDEEPVEPDPLPEEVYERAELQQLLQEAILSLLPRTREVVLLRYVGDFTFAEIGKTLSIPENTARTLFQRAKPVLRAYLRKRL
ncbi:MAG: sigma-70 family RNA polymerase sigma factor [Chloroflexi bacterium]|nr:sigma-70 family RNA polymerase sigma factor [Chloroflexota bacterium]